MITGNDSVVLQKCACVKEYAVCSIPLIGTSGSLVAAHIAYVGTPAINAVDI